jgi:hypothetical protein
MQNKIVLEARRSGPGRVHPIDSEVENKKGRSCLRPAAAGRIYLLIT